MMKLKEKKKEAWHMPVRPLDGKNSELLILRKL